MILRPLRQACYQICAAREEKLQMRKSLDIICSLDAILATSRNNDFLELMLAASPLLTFIIAGVSLGGSNWAFSLKILLKIIGLGVGALPGAALLIQGLAKGHIFAGPVNGGVDAAPAQMLARRGVGKSPDGANANAVYFP